LATSFGRRFDPWRGYGPAMVRLLPRLGAGEPWQTTAASLFEGQGSFGNGAAMRVAPLGAYFADDLDAVVDQARRSAVVTHAHPEGVAGAVAVAVAAAWAWRLRAEQGKATGHTLLDRVLPYVPDGEVRAGIERARALPAGGRAVGRAVKVLGNGDDVTAQDTVPFVLWCASWHLDDYERALWTTASGLGDVDTTCAMVGGIVAAYTGVEGIPTDWRESREALPFWAIEDEASGKTITLYRPVGPKELGLIRASGWRAFPPRLPEQPIFYPVLEEEYAAQIAREWNARDPNTGHVGYVTRFRVEAVYVSRFRVQMAGASLHRELWVPAEELEEFNRHIVGPIEVVSEFRHDSTEE
jgi:ADP-ribosylglycohydrolase